MTRPPLQRHALSELSVLAAVAEECSFTKAAARLDLSASALSHAVRALEERMGVKLLHRTTRSVSPTEAGAALLARLRPALDDIDAAVAELGAYRERPAGRVRISSHRQAAMQLIFPKLKALQQAHPEVIVELSLDDGLADIVAEGFDAGVRNGEQLAKDMVSMRIGPDLRSVVVGSPAYFRDHPPPRTPDDLKHHRCLAYRYISSRALHRWEFQSAGTAAGSGDGSENGRRLRVAIEPALIVDDAEVLVRGAVEGLGLAYVMDAHVQAEVEAGALLRVLDDWSCEVPGPFLYYPSRRHLSPAFRVVAQALRHVPEPSARSAPGDVDLKSPKRSKPRGGRPALA